MNKSKKINPKVSIITPTLNQGNFIIDCISSIENQTYKNIEHIVIDGISSDNTVSILKKHKKIKWISEKDSGYWDAVSKGMKMATGKYVMICMASDGYLNKKWVEKCVEIMEADHEISMVWGLPRWLEGNKLTDVCYAHFHNKRVPQKFDWLTYWLMSGECLPNGNFCVNKKVFDQCNTVNKNTPKGAELYIFNFNFNVKGYLPYHIPEVAEFAREHPGQIGESWTKKGWLPKARKKYMEDIKIYKEKLITKKKTHIFLDCNNKKINQKVKIENINYLNEKFINYKILIYLIMQRGPKKIYKIVNTLLKK